MILADKIIRLRKQNGWSQEELAEKMDVSRQSISKWESGASIPDINRIIKLSTIFGVSTDYLLLDELEDEIDNPSIEEDFSKRNVSLDTAITYMDLKKEVAPKIGLGVSLCILSPVVLLALLGLTQTTARMPISQDMAAGIGVSVLLVFVSLGVLLFISNGMKLNDYEFLEKEDFVLDYGVQGIVEKKMKEFENTNRKCSMYGTVLCILSCIPLIVSGAIFNNEFMALGCVDILLLLVSIGVYLFVYAGNIQESFDRLLQIKDYTMENKKVSNKISAYLKTYWMVTLAIFLAISFITDNWDRSWIVWPVASVLFVGFKSIVKDFVRKRL